MIFSHVLYQLSYLGETNKIKSLVENPIGSKAFCVRTMSASSMREEIRAGGRGYSMIWWAS